MENLVTRVKYEIKDIDDYKNQLTEDEKKLVVRHANKYQRKPDICAWYDDWDDFCSDWVETYNYTKSQARDLLNGKCENAGEFKILKSGKIIRFSI